MEKNIYNALERVATKLNENKIDWMLVGSANLALQGMDFYPRDLDFCVKEEDLEKIRLVFGQYAHSNVEEKKSPFSGIVKKLEFSLGDISVEFVGEKNRPLYLDYLNKGDYLTREIYGVKYNLSKLENEALCYDKLEREEKANKIREHLEKKD